MAALTDRIARGIGADLIAPTALEKSPFTIACVGIVRKLGMPRPGTAPPVERDARALVIAENEQPVLDDAGRPASRRTDSA